MSNNLIPVSIWLQIPLLQVPTSGSTAGKNTSLIADIFVTGKPQKTICRKVHPGIIQ
jgi:hypothetical protein